MQIINEILARLPPPFIGGCQKLNYLKANNRVTQRDTGLKKLAPRMLLICSLFF